MSVTFRYRHTRHAPVVFATHAAGVPREITRYARAQRNKTRRMTRPVIACYPLHQRVGMCVAVCAPSMYARAQVCAQVCIRVALCVRAYLCAEECVPARSRCTVLDVSQDMQRKVGCLRRRSPRLSVLVRFDANDISNVNNVCASRPRLY